MKSHSPFEAKHVWQTQTLNEKFSAKMYNAQNPSSICMIMCSQCMKYVPYLSEIRVFKYDFELTVILCYKLRSRSISLQYLDTGQMIGSK